MQGLSIEPDSIHLHSYWIIIAFRTDLLYLWGYLRMHHLRPTFTMPLR